MESLKTITIPLIPNASLELATELKRRLRWLNSPEEIQLILGRGTYTKVVEHIRPEFVVSVTAELEALGIIYSVWSDEDAPKGC